MSRSGGVRNPTGAWPEVNDRVRVRLDLPAREEEDQLDLLTRVEDESEGRLVVAAPTFAGDLHVAQPGLGVVLSWANDRGQCRQSFVLVAVVRGDVPCWELEAVGDVTLEQRRRFVRVAVVGRGRLRAVPSPDDLDRPAPQGQAGSGTALQEDAPAADDGEGTGEPGASCPVQLVDLSEGGACVRAPEAAWLHAGRRAVLAFEVDGGPVDQLADVLRVTRTTGPRALDPSAQLYDVVLAFVEPVVAADRVRRHVMRIQIENRRRGER